MSLSQLGIETGKDLSDKDLVQSLLCWGRDTLRLNIDISDPVTEARLLLLAAAKCPHNSYLPSKVTDTQIVEYYQYVQRRFSNEPFAYIVGEKGFWTLDLKVNPSTLIPRADTETLIELLLELRPDKNQAYRFLDLGTGTGCLLLASLSEYRLSTGLGIDISSEAVALATENALANHLEKRSEFRQGNWAKNLNDKFDIILSNPPYINAEDMKKLDKQVVDFEPVSALLGGEDGLYAYRTILKSLPNLLNHEGVAIFEIGYDQYPAIVELIKELDFILVASKKDIGGIIRAVAVKCK